MRRVWKSSLVVAGVLVMAAGCSSAETQRVESLSSQGPSEPSDSQRRPWAFVVPSEPSISGLQQLMASSVKVDYAPYYSLRSMAEASDVVVKGRIKGVREGRRFYNLSPTPGDPLGDRPYLSMLVLDIDVDAVLGGAHPDVLEGKYYFEVLAPVVTEPGETLARAIFAEEYAAFLPPDAPVILFSESSRAVSATKARLEGAEPAAVYLTPRVQGYLMEEAGSVIVISGEPLPGGPKASLAEVEAELVAARVQGKAAAGSTP